MFHMIVYICKCAKNKGNKNFKVISKITNKKLQEFIFIKKKFFFFIYFDRRGIFIEIGQKIHKQF